MDSSTVAGLLHVISSAVTPVVMISACASLILTINSKHQNIADRIRAIATEIRGANCTSARCKQLIDELHVFQDHGEDKNDHGNIERGDSSMLTELKIQTTVLPGHRIEVITPELPEGACVELMVTDLSEQTMRRYPSRLEAEYDVLIVKKLNRTLTEAEACRLQDIRNVIAEIDRLTLTDDIRVQRLDQIEAELAQLRAEIEALPDA